MTAEAVGTVVVCLSSVAEAAEAVVGMAVAMEADCNFVVGFVVVEIVCLNSIVVAAVVGVGCNFVVVEFVASLVAVPAVVEVGVGSPVTAAIDRNLVVAVIG